MRAAVTSGRAEADPEGATPTAARQASTSRKSRILKAFFHILRVPWLSATRYTRRAPHGPSPSASPGRAAKWARSAAGATSATAAPAFRSEEHTSELQSLMRISYAGFCLKKKHNLTKEN